MSILYSIIRKDGFPVEHVPPDGIGQWLKKCGRLTDPISQCGTWQVQTLAFKDLALPLEWEGGWHTWRPEVSA